MVETITLNTDPEQYTGSVQGKYENYASDRYTFLARAREAAAITIPSLLPKEGHTGSSILPTPFQSVGARGVNNLASKLLLSLLPPNAPFFRLVIDDAELEQMVESQKGAVEEALSKID